MGLELASHQGSNFLKIKIPYPVSLSFFCFDEYFFLAILQVMLLKRSNIAKSIFNFLFIFDHFFV